VLNLFQRREWLPADAVETMRAREHDGGFSVSAEVWVPSWDRAGLERPIRYCARPLFACERLVWIESDQRLIYHLPKPRPDGQTALYLTLEFLDHLAAPIPPPRKHCHRYHGVLAPNAPLRAAVTARAGLPFDGSAGPLMPRAPAVSPDVRTADTPPAAYARYLSAVLRARIYAILPLLCPVCGSEMRLIAAVTEPEPVQRILRHLGEPPLPPYWYASRYRYLLKNRGPLATLGANLAWTGGYSVHLWRQALTLSLTSGHTTRMRDFVVRNAQLMLGRP
jgi:hypothetical protein